MKFTCDKESFVKYLGAVTKFVAKNHPVYSLVNLEIVGDDLHLRTFNGNTYIDLRLFVVGDEDGNILVNPSYLLPIVKTLKDGDIEFRANSKFEVSQNNSCRDVAIQDGENFINKPHVDTEFTIHIPSIDDLVAAMKSVRFAKAVDNSEFPILNGYYVDTAENLLMAGDGRRVAYAPFTYDDGKYKFVLPPQTWDVVTSLNKLLGGDVELLGSSSSWLQLNFNNGEAVVCLGTLYGEYPSAALTWLKQLREDTTGTIATFNQDDLINRAKIAAMYSGLASRARMFSGVRIDMTEGGVQFTMQSPDGNLDDYCEVPVSGPPTSVSLFPPYLQRAAANAPDEEIDLVVWSAHQAVLIRSGDWFVVQAPFADSDTVDKWREEHGHNDN